MCLVHGVVVGHIGLAELSQGEDYLCIGTREQPRFGPAITEYITLWSYTGNCMVLLIGYSKRENSFYRGPLPVNLQT